MPYRLLAIDIDGTLLNSDRKIADSTLSAICAAMERGVRVTLCTGRSMPSAVHIMDRLSLNTPVILNGGALIFDSHRRRSLYMRNLPRRVAEDAVHQLRSLSCYPIIYSPLPESQYFYYDVFDPANPDFQQYVDKNSGRAHRVDDVLEAIWGDPAMVAFTDRTDKIRALEPELVSRLPETTVTLEISPGNQTYCHVTLPPRGVSKGSGLRELACLLGIDLAETIAIGDNLNDLDMMQTAGLGVAMGNATPETKARADYVTASNNDDGIAKVIDRFIL